MPLTSYIGQCEQVKSVFGGNFANSLMSHVKGVKGTDWVIMAFMQALCVSTFGDYRFSISSATTYSFPASHSPAPFYICFPPKTSSQKP